MNLFIRTSLDAVRSVIQKLTPALLAALPTPRAPFAAYANVFTGVMLNPPTVWIEPRTTDIGAEGTPTPYIDAVTVKLGISGADPEQIADATLDYVLVCDQVLRSQAALQDLDETIMRIYVQRHDYGPLYQRTGGFAKFPELHLLIEREEVMTA